jgi:hypothetical protein
MKSWLADTDREAGLCVQEFDCPQDGAKTLEWLFSCGRTWLTGRRLGTPQGLALETSLPL